MPLIAHNNEDNDGTDAKNTCIFPEDAYNRSWGGIPLVYLFGGCHQLPPVDIKLNSDLDSISKMHTSDLQ